MFRAARFIIGSFFRSKPVIKSEAGSYWLEVGLYILIVVGVFASIGYLLRDTLVDLFHEVIDDVESF